MKKLTILLFFMLFFMTTIIRSQWPQDPSADARVLLGSFYNNVISDGSGGAIIIGRKDNQFTAQRVDQNGYVLWDPTMQGLQVIIPDSVNDVTIGRTYIWPDSKGGIFIAYDYFDFLRILTDPEYVVIYDLDTYVQHLDWEGQRTWGNKGVPLSTLKGTNPDYYYVASSEIKAIGGDGSGGIMTIWVFGYYDMDGTAIGGIYLQCFDSLGHPIWEENGRKINYDGFMIKAIVDGKGSCFALTGMRNGASITKYLIKVDFDGQLLWQEQLPANFIESDIISDDLGGAYVLSYYYYNQNNPENMGIVTQRFDKDGNKLWGESGIVICDTIGDQGRLESAIRFKESNLIISWSEVKEIRQVYLQRIDDNGTLLWNKQGVPVSSVNSSKSSCRLLQSSENEIIAAFYDNRDTVGITYAQKFNENGAAQWGSRDVLVSTRVYPGGLISDGRGGAIICSGQFSPRGICVYRIDKNGNLGGVVSVEDSKEIEIPKEFDLYQNHPNPFGIETVIDYFIPQGEFPIQLKVYDINGKEVVTLVNETKTAGKYTVKWPGLNNDRMPVASGIYICRFQAGEVIYSRRLILLK